MGILSCTSCNWVQYSWNTESHIYGIWRKRQVIFTQMCPLSSAEKTLPEAKSTQTIVVPLTPDNNYWMNWVWKNRSLLIGCQGIRRSGNAGQDVFGCFAQVCSKWQPDVAVLHGCTGLFKMAELPDKKSSVLRHLSNIAFFLQFLSSEGPSSPPIENIIKCIEHIPNIKIHQYVCPYGLMVFNKTLFCIVPKLFKVWVCVDRYEW